MTTLATPAIHAGFYFPGGKVPGKTKTSHLPLETNFPLADTAQQNILIPKKGDQPSINNAACSNVPGMKYLEVLMHFGLNSHQSSVQIGSELRFYYLFFFFFFCTCQTGVQVESSRKRDWATDPMQICAVQG
jgi:hypothetical protein